MVNDDLQRIIFLDIDGPLIPSPLYNIDRLCSLRRSVMSTVAIGCILNLCNRADAKIVTNTMHNYHDTSTGDLRNDLIEHGILETYFHNDWRTKFPYDNIGSDFMTDLHNITHPRLRAIQQWQHKNGNADWICFDDELFTDDKRLIHIDFDKGITTDERNKAFDLWGIKTAHLFGF